MMNGSAPLPLGLDSVIRGLWESDLASHVEVLQATLGLTPGQAAVAIGIWCGLSEKRVAALLGHSREAVHAQLRKIYAKLQDHGLRRGQVSLALAVERALRHAKVPSQSRSGPQRSEK